MAAGIFAAAMLYSGATFILFQYLHSSVPSFYMDEEFHIPQAAKYCEGNFTEWDPKITTLPGLYVFSAILWKVFSKVLFLFQTTPFCDAWHLRLTNVIFSILNFLVFYRLLVFLNRNHKEFRSSHAILTSLNMATFPLLYFFSFLYYTDQASTLMVFTMIYFHLRNQRRISTAFGFLAVFTRQTNIVWVACLVVLDLWESYKIIMKTLVKKEDLRRISADEDVQLLCAPFLALLQKPTAANGKRVSGYFMGVILESFPRLIGYLSVLIGFTVFIFINKGIVVGDRSAHQPVFNVPQLFYFAIFTSFFTLPYIFDWEKLGGFMRFLVRRPFISAFSVAIIIGCIHLFTHVHLYLISDNRHYTFYFWKKVIDRTWWMRYSLAPVYFFSLWNIWRDFRSEGFFRTLLYFAAIFVQLTPQKLLEFRYFILPFLLYRVQLKNVSMKHLFLEFFFFQCVNAVTLYMFLMKPFVGPDGKVARFMW